MNKERKEEYIEEYRSINIHVDNNLRPKFRSVESYEEILGKDLCEFTISEIVDYYKFICTPSLEHLMSITSWFSNYTQWCLQRTLVPDCQNHYLELNNDILLSCINVGLAKQRVISREELIRQLETLENPSDKFMMLALFEGICGKNYYELYYAKYDDIKGNMMRLYGGREIEISDRLKSYAYESAHKYTYYCFVYNEASMRSNERQFDTSDDSIIKRMYNSSEYPSETAIFQRMHNRCTRMKKHFGANCFRSKALIESGRIDLIQRLMETGNYDDVASCINSNKEIIFYKYGKIASIPRYVAKYGEYFGR